MTEIFLAFAPRDRQNAAFVADGLRAAGYVVKDGFTPAGEAKPLEDMALDIKRAAAVAPLLTDDSEKADAFIQQLRAALLYEKPHIFAVRLEPGVEVSAFAERRELLRDTIYEADADKLVQILEEAIDLSGGRALPRGLGAKDKRGGGAKKPRFGRRDAANEEASDNDKVEPVIANPSDSQGPASVAPLLEALRKNKITPRKLSPEQIAVGDDVELDSLGLPKTSDAMVAHWRLIEQSGSIADIRRFANDYEADPYFTAQASELEAGLIRKRYWRGALIGLDGAIGMLVAGVIGYGVLAYCADDSCANFTPLPTARASVSLNDPGAAASLREAQRQVDTWRGRAQAADRELQTLRASLGAETDRVIALERQLSDAEGVIASLRGGSAAPQPQPQPAPPRQFDPNPQVEADLVAARRAAQSARDDLQRAELRLRDQTSQMAELRQQLQQSQAEIARLRNEPARVADRIPPQPTPEPRPAFTPSVGPRPAPDQASGGLAGAERILIFYRDQLQSAAESGRRRPVLGADDLRALQSCILRYTGALAQTDGVWGIETTSALFTIDVEEAGWIIDCLRQRG